jgi:hypothetical protein
MKHLFIFIFTLSAIISNAQKINLETNYSDIVNSGSKKSYKNGVQIIKYFDNGISIATSFDKINTYGEYFQLNIEIVNQTGQDFTFFPSKILSVLEEYKTDKKTNEQILKSQKFGELLASDDYLKKVNNKQFWSKVGSNITLSNRASMAGQSSSRTQAAVAGGSSTSVTGNASVYDNKNNKVNATASVNGSSSFAAAGVSNTQNFDGQAAYQAQKEVDQEMKQRDFELNQIKNVLDQGYLKTNTIENSQKIFGFINIKYDDADKVKVLIPVNGKNYFFVFDVEKK